MPRGVPKGVVVKYFMGIPMIIILILVIWLPLLAFSLLNRIGIVLLPENVIMSVSIEGYPVNLDCLLYFYLGGFHYDQ